MPESLLEKHGIAPLEYGIFTIVGGSEVEYGYGMALSDIDGREFPCPVIFAVEGEFLLGATTLQIFNLMVDPAEERLVDKPLRADLSSGQDRLDSPQKRGQRHSELKIGVLAVQGDFAEHIAILRNIDVDAREVRLPEQLDALDGLIIPGGESTTLSRLMSLYNLREPIAQLASDGVPVWGTCAGMIMLANEITEAGPGPSRPHGHRRPAKRLRPPGRQFRAGTANLPSLRRALQLHLHSRPCGHTRGRVGRSPGQPGRWTPRGGTAGPTSWRRPFIPNLPEMPVFTSISVDWPDENLRFRQ